MRRVVRHRLIPVVALAVLCAAGCQENGSLPLAPPAAAPPAGPWLTVHPERPVPDLGFVFALDADDVWIGTDGDVALHHDGEGVTWHDLPPGIGEPDAIHGCAWNEVYLLDGDHLARWDGRAWREAGDVDPERRLDPYCLWNDAPGVVYVGGRDRRTDRAYVTCRREGEGAKRWLLSEGLGLTLRVWRADPGGPLLAFVRDDLRETLLRWTGDRWAAVAPGADVETAAGPYLLVRDPQHHHRRDLQRVGRDGAVAVVCEGLAGGSAALLSCRYPLLIADGQIGAVIGCEWRHVGEFDAPYHGLFGVEPHFGVPRRPGSRGSCFYLVDRSNALWRHRWQADGSLGATVVFGDPEVVPDQHLCGAGGNLYATDRHGGLAVGTAGGWSREDLPGGEPWRPQPLPDGSLLLAARGDWNEYTLGRRHRDGRWDWAPTLAGHDVHGIGCDPATDTYYAMTSDARFLVCRDGQWRIRDTLGGHCVWYGLVAADQQYVLLRLDQDRTTRLARFDGERWHEVPYPGPGRIVSLAAAPARGELVVVHATYEPWTWREGLGFHDGAAWRFDPATSEYGAWTHNLQVAADGTIYSRNHGGVAAYHELTWKRLFARDDGLYPGSHLEDAWVDARGDLHVLDDQHRIHRLPDVRGRLP